MQSDPLETANLVVNPKHQDLVKQFNARLFEVIKETEGLTIPIYPDRGGSATLRRIDGTPAAEFPPHWMRR